MSVNPASIPVPHPGLAFCQAAERNVTKLGEWVRGEEHKTVAADAALAIRTLLAALEAPASSEGSEPVAWVGDYRKSDGTTDHYVMIGRDGREMSLQMHGIRGRAEYEAAEINHVLTGSPKPEFDQFDLDPPTPEPAPKPVRQVRMWLVEHEWKPRSGAVRGSGATSYHDARHTLEADVDAEVARIKALPEVAWVKKTPLYADLVDASVPEFTGLAKRKLDDLLERGWRINGYSIIKDGDIGLATAGAFVGWFSVAERNAEAAQAALDRAKNQLAPEVSTLIDLLHTAKRMVANVQARPVGLAAGTSKSDPFGVAFGALDSVITALQAKPAASACPAPGPDADTYYAKGQDGPWYEALGDKEFAWELTKAAQDLNDTGLGDDLDKWMPFQVMIADAADRIERLLKTGALPEGWMAVPLEITDQMQEAAMEVLLHRGDIYAREDGTIVIETITPKDLWDELLRVVAASRPSAQEVGEAEVG